MSIKEVKEQFLDDVLTILEEFGVDEAMEGADYNNLVRTLCDTIVNKLNKINN